MSEKHFHNAKQLLNLKDSFRMGESDFLISTMMLEKPKEIHGVEYWFETYLIELFEGKVIWANLLDQHTIILDAIQGHKFAVIAMDKMFKRIQEAFNFKLLEEGNRVRKEEQEKIEQLKNDLESLQNKEDASESPKKKVSKKKSDAQDS